MVTLEEKLVDHKCLHPLVTNNVYTDYLGKNLVVKIFQYGPKCWTVVQMDITLPRALRLGWQVTLDSALSLFH